MLKFPGTVRFIRSGNDIFVEAEEEDFPEPKKSEANE